MPNRPEAPGALRQMARALVRLYYPRIEVTGGELIPATGPVILVANHPNSLIDPVLLGIAARRPVRLLAKAPLFNLPVFGAVLRALGMVPAYRGSDDPKQVSKNLESLAAAGRELAKGAAMGIFPEGKSHDALQLAMMRSGAARLALQAFAAGATTLRIVPVGLNYERKERFRTAVWIRVGRPIEVARWLDLFPGDEHRAMRTLTQEIDARLRRCVTHLNHARWEPLLADVEALFVRPAGRDGSLALLHQRKRVADAINRAHREQPAVAEAAAGRVQAHAAALRREGVPVDGRIFALRGWRLGAVMLRDALTFAVGSVVAVLAVLHHAVPYALVRLIAGRMAGKGQVLVALNRLGLSIPIYAAWYAFVGWRMSLYFAPWVTWTWLVLMPPAGIVALAVVRRLRHAVPFWWAEFRLLLRPDRARALRAEHAALAEHLAGFAGKHFGKSPRGGTPGVVYRPPRWAAPAAALVSLSLAFTVGAWLLRDRPIEFLRQDAPALAALPPAELEERLAADERALTALIDALEQLEERFRGFERALLAGERSYYRPQDDDEIRRMLVSYLSLRAALLRMVWQYQRHDQIEGEPARLRALLLHYTAAALAYDYAARFVLAFDGRPMAIRKLNEAEPAWDLPAGTYDSIRANLAHVSHRSWLEEGWRNYHATLPKWEAHGLRAGAPHARFHAVIATAGENTAALSERLVGYKIQTALSDVRRFAQGGWYRASAAVSTLIGDARIRTPRGGAGLITPELLAELRPKLRPGDVLIERRNWYLSNAFLPGYWPHAALYVGTAEELRAVGLDRDPRIARQLAEFARVDAKGHRPAVIEAISEGVVFTTLEHSVGEADSVAVLRPRVSEEQRREAIARAFSHAGKPYDFDFDFFSADKLVCTEVVYRAYGDYVALPLVEILGRKTLPALNILRQWSAAETSAQWELIEFLDGDEIAGTCQRRDAAALRESMSRPALTWLQ